MNTQITLRSVYLWSILGENYFRFVRRHNSSDDLKMSLRYLKDISPSSLTRLEKVLGMANTTTHMLENHFFSTGFHFTGKVTL